MSEAKFVGYFRLVEACRQPGCPVCRRVIDDSRGYLAALLHEHVTDPQTRRALRASWGLCAWHAAMLPDVAPAALGAAIIYEDLLRLVLQRTEGLAYGDRRARRRAWLAALRQRPHPGASATRYRRRPACPACVNAAATERRCLDTLLQFIDDGDLQAAYARSEGLCVPHLFGALEVGRDRRALAALVGRTREAWQRLARTLASFLAKHDYRNRQPCTEAEAAASRRALALLAGATQALDTDGRARRRHPP
jgi:hypothetical protein